MTTNTRPDSYILELIQVKSNLRMQIMHCNRNLDAVNHIKLNPNYDAAATTLEKSNFDTLINLISQGLEVLESIVWE
jgi:hypothetical protein